MDQTDQEVLQLLAQTTTVSLSDLQECYLCLGDIEQVKEIVNIHQNNPALVIFNDINILTRLLDTNTVIEDHLFDDTELEFPIYRNRSSIFNSLKNLFNNN